MMKGEGVLFPVALLLSYLLLLHSSQRTERKMRGPPVSSRSVIGANQKTIPKKLFEIVSGEQIRKPGSVLNDSIIIYLGLPLPTGSRDLTRKLDGPPNTFLCGLAPDGVYLAGLSPNRRCALTAPFHPYPPQRAVYFCGTVPEVALAGR